MAKSSHMLQKTRVKVGMAVNRMLFPTCRFILFTIALALPISPLQSLAADTFIIGVAPHTSSRIILDMYEPLRLHLEKALGMPVEVLTAPDFEVFARRALDQQYDIAITTGHQARLLQTDAKYLPLLTYEADFKAVAIVAVHGPIHKPHDLKGKNVLGLSAASGVTLWGQHWLKKNDLGGIPVRYVSASDSVAQLVITGEAAAGFTSLTNFEKLAPNIQSQLRILAESPSLVGRVYMLNSRQNGRQKTIDGALWAFATTGAGKHYFEVNKLGGYRRLKPGELPSMDAYAAEVRRLLQKGAR
jgi:phosphonate transport system substrate-binding protein